MTAAQHTPGPTKAERNAYHAEWERNVEKAKQRCQGCGGTGFYADGPLGRDACVDCDGTGNAKHSTPNAMAAAIATAEGSAS